MEGLDGDSCRGNCFIGESKKGNTGLVLGHERALAKAVGSGFGPMAEQQRTEGVTVGVTSNRGQARGQAGALMVLGEGCAGEGIGTQLQPGVGDAEARVQRAW